MLRARFELGGCSFAITMMALTFAIPRSLLAQAHQGTPAESSASAGSSLKFVYQPSWAGYILYAPGYVPLQVPAARFQAIEAEWTVPSALPTINCKPVVGTDTSNGGTSTDAGDAAKKRRERTDGSSIWIALDGWGETFTDPKGNASTDLLQAGTETDVGCLKEGGSPGPASAFFWIEWDGVSNVRVTKKHLNLPVEVGDRVHVRIAVDTEGPDAWQAATVYFENETTGYSHATHFLSGCIIYNSAGGCAQPETRATLFGNTAEGIVETTFYDFNNSQLPNTLNNFGTVTVTNFTVMDDQGNTYTPAAPGGAQQEIDWMTFNGNSLASGDTLLACAAISPKDVTLWRAPYKVVRPGDQGSLKPKPQTCDGTIQPPMPSSAP